MVHYGPAGDLLSEEFLAGDTQYRPNLQAFPAAIQKDCLCLRVVLKKRLQRPEIFAEHRLRALDLNGGKRVPAVDDEIHFVSCARVGLKLRRT